MTTKRSKGRRTGTMPVMEFGSGRGALTLAVGKRGRVQLAGNGSFSPDGFRDFLLKAAWYLDQLQQMTTEATWRAEAADESAPVRAPVAAAMTAAQMELFATDRMCTERHPQ